MSLLYFSYCFFETFTCKIWVLLWSTGDARYKALGLRGKKNSVTLAVVPPGSLARNLREGWELPIKALRASYCWNGNMFWDSKEMTKHQQQSKSAHTDLHMPLQRLKYLSFPGSLDGKGSTGLWLHTAPIWLWPQTRTEAWTVLSEGERWGTRFMDKGGVALFFL